MSTLIVFCVLLGLLSAATAHMVCQSPRNPGFRFEAGVSNFAIALVVMGVAWVSQFTLALTVDGHHPSFHSSLLSMVPIAMGVAIVQFILAWRREARDVNLLGQFLAGFVPAAFIALAMNWVPSFVAVPIVWGLTAATAILMAVLAVAFPQTPGAAFTGWVGVAAGLVVATARRDGTPHALEVWQIALGVGALVSPIVHLVMNLWGGDNITPARLRTGARTILLVTCALYSALAIVQLNGESMQPAKAAEVTPAKPKGDAPKPAESPTPTA